MYFRATSLAVSSRAIHYSAQQSSNILKLQEQISSGIRISRSSDDPVAYQRITSLQSQRMTLQTSDYIITDAETKLNIGVSQLREIHSLMTSARQLAQSGVQATSDAERQALAVEAEGVLARLQQLANADHSGQYLFGGSRYTEPPFSFARPTTPGGTLDSNYKGSSQVSSVVIGPGTKADVFHPGTDIFYQNQRAATILYGKSGARTGSGTDTIVGRATLQVRHTGTVFAAGSGIATGTSSLDGDTILGPAGRHKIEVIDTSGTGAFGTVSLNGGPAVPFDNTQTNLEVSGRNGERIYIDTTAITAGFSGTIDITANGTLSVDGGTTTTAIDFSGNQIIRDGNSGKMATINSTDITFTGDDYLEFPGTSNVFQTVFELVQDLKSTRTLDGSQLAETLGRKLGELDRLSDKVLLNVGIQSTTLQGLEQLKFRNQDLNVEAETLQSNLQSTNLPEAIMRLQNEMTLQQYTYTVASQILSQRLLDFLQ